MLYASSLLVFTVNGNNMHGYVYQIYLNNKYYKLVHITFFFKFIILIYIKIDLYIKDKLNTY